MKKLLGKPREKIKKAKNQLTEQWKSNRMIKALKKQTKRLPKVFIQINLREISIKKKLKGLKPLA
jgi:hypothetical protein